MSKGLEDSHSWENRRAKAAEKDKPHKWRAHMTIIAILLLFAVASRRFWRDLALTIGGLWDIEPERSSASLAPQQLMPPLRSAAPNDQGNPPSTDM
jgi:hypothetical protein